MPEKGFSIFFEKNQGFYAGKQYFCVLDFLPRSVVFQKKAKKLHKNITLKKNLFFLQELLIFRLC
jgi:hypothetical protein